MTGTLCSLDCWPCLYLSWLEKKITWQKFLQTYDGSRFIIRGQTFRETESIQLLCSLQLIHLPESVCTSLSTLKWPIFSTSCLYHSFIMYIYFLFYLLYLTLYFELDTTLLLHSLLSSLFTWFISYSSPCPFLSVIVSSLFISFIRYMHLVPLVNLEERVDGGYSESQSKNRSNGRCCAPYDRVWVWENHRK